MTPAEAFKFGFLLQCAQDGCSSKQIERRIKLASFTDVGRAAAGTAGAVAGAGTGAIDNTSKLLKSLFLASGLGGAAVGAGGGYLLASAMDDNVDPADARDAETLAEYQRAIQELSRRRQLSVA